VRAYGGTAARSLSLAKRIALREMTRLVITFAPRDTGAVYAAVSGYAARAVDSLDDLGRVGIEVDAPLDDVEELRQSLASATHGRAQMRGNDCFTS
jgi:putative IMPACT (imprinted ancient) family translation regulator